MQTPENTQQILDILSAKYGVVASFLNHRNAFELLIAVILSAQTTDALVNKVTPELFESYPTPQQMKQAPVSELERLISRVNYYRTKAKAIKETARMLDEEFSNVIPRTINELIKLPGVGRKVANVIMAGIFGVIEGIVVDTHVKRVSYRIGWTQSTDPAKVERDLMSRWPQEHWLNTPKQLILIGRNYCFARKPNCLECPLQELCEKNY